MIFEIFKVWAQLTGWLAVIVVGYLLLVFSVGKMVDYVLNLSISNGAKARIGVVVLVLLATLMLSTVIVIHRHNVLAGSL